MATSPIVEHFRRIRGRLRRTGIFGMSLAAAIVSAVHNIVNDRFGPDLRWIGWVCLVGLLLAFVVNLVAFLLAVASVTHVAAAAEDPDHEPET